MIHKDLKKKDSLEKVQDFKIYMIPLKFWGVIKKNQTLKIHVKIQNYKICLMTITENQKKIYFPIQAHLRRLQRDKAKWITIRY